MMKKFATQSQCFMDAYDCGLDGKQAVWAAKKYRGHQVLTHNICNRGNVKGGPCRDSLNPLFDHFISQNK